MKLFIDGRGGVKQEAVEPDGQMEVRFELQQCPAVMDER